AFTRQRVDFPARRCIQKARVQFRCKIASGHRAVRAVRPRTLCGISEHSKDIPSIRTQTCLLIGSLDLQQRFGSSDLPDNQRTGRKPAFAFLSRDSEIPFAIRADGHKVLRIYLILRKNRPPGTYIAKMKSFWPIYSEQPFVYPGTAKEFSR